MAENIQPPRHEQSANKEQSEPGLFESIGSFPVWLLKIIDFFTPQSLIQKPDQKTEPPKPQP